MSIFKYIYANPNEKYDIKFDKDPDMSGENMSDVERELYEDIERVIIVLKSLHRTNESVKDIYFNKILTLAQAGFIGNEPDPTLALTSLKAIKDEILTVEGHRIKNKYMLYLGISSLISILLCWVIFVIIEYFADITTIKTYFVVWTGAMVGAWISFGARKFNIQFDELNVLEEDKMYIYIRLPYIGICSLIFLLFLNSGIFNFQIGSISLDDLKANIELQLVLGIIAGLFESKLGVKIYEKAQNITSNT